MDFRFSIIQHSLEDRPKEACGYIREEHGVREAIRCSNTAHDPTKSFRISPVEYTRDYLAGKILATYHSHPESDSSASPHDEETVKNMLVPMYIYSTLTAEMSAIVPDNMRKAPYEGRHYLPLVYDCATLVQDYFENELGIKSPFLPRTWKDGEFGHSKLVQYMIEQGFERALVPKKYDVILMNLRSSLPNHAAVYLGDSVMLHQLEGVFPTPTVYDGGYFEKVTSHVFRHPKFR